MPSHALTSRYTSLFLLSLWLLAGRSAAQQPIAVSLTATQGYGPFPGGQVISWPLEHQPAGIKMPPGIHDVRIRYFDLQPAQTRYAQYRAHTLSKDQFYAYLAQTGTDTLQLQQHDSFRHQVAILAGYRQEQELTLIVDANNNGDFTDDAPLYYPLHLTKAAERAAMEMLPAVTVTYDYFDGRALVTKTTSIVPNPYKGSMQVSFATNDLIEQKLFLGVGTNHHQAGTVTLQQQPYRVALSNSFVASTYTKANSSLRITPVGDAWPHNLPATPAYQVGDVITLAQYQYRFTSVSLWGDTIRLEPLGYAARPEGLTEGLYLPRFVARTVDQQTFDLAQAQGKYVLLDFWGTWCGPCIAAFPKLRALHARFQQANLLVIGIAYDETLDKVQRFLAQNPLAWPTIYQAQNAREQNLVQQLKVDTFPTTILLDPTGKILARGKDVDALLPLLIEKLP